VPGAVEVCGEAAVWFHPGSVEQLAGAMAEIAATGTAELSAAGRRRAAEFSWAASAKAHLAAYSLALR
jgi:glycosyltransferase involved in cell wall biosynthesis